MKRRRKRSSCDDEPRKRRKIEHFPLDCIGEVIKFLKCPKDFLNFYCLSKRVKQYIDKTPHLTENICFRIESNKTPKDFNFFFVVNLKIKNYDMNDYEFEGAGAGDVSRPDDFQRVQELINKYNEYESKQLYLKESSPGSEFYSLISENVTITEGDLFDIEDRMKQILRENGLTNL